MCEHSTITGDNRRKGTPVNISNTEVKVPIAEGTVLETIWENRTLPVFHLCISLAGAFFEKTTQSF